MRLVIWPPRTSSALSDTSEVDLGQKLPSLPSRFSAASSLHGFCSFHILFFLPFTFRKRIISPNRVDGMD
jgi:hypothetical protein